MEVRITLAYCPVCMAEYEQGSSECVDCHVVLASGPPPRQQQAGLGSGIEGDLDLAVVRSFMGADAPLRGELARNLLQAHGIPVILMGENSIRVMPFHGMALLQVKREDLARATEILDGILDGPELPANEDLEME